MEKRLKNFRLSDKTLTELQEITQTLGISETEAVSRAIHLFYLQIKGEEISAIGGSSLVPLSEYLKVQESLAKAFYRIGELEGVLKEREERLKEKDELIRELRQMVKELQAKPVKRWWEFWR
jgi:DNA-binding Lrp family transcriptional regulator